jgi:hypothetical protein
MIDSILFLNQLKKWLPKKNAPHFGSPKKE